MLRSIPRSVRRAAPALALAAMLGGSGLSAQVAVAPPPNSQTDMLHLPAQNMTVLLLTMGNGEQVWELFGHTAIVIRDNISGRDTVFNWGVFDSHKPNFILHFLQGLMLYKLGGETLEQLLYQYRYFNRSVTSQELDLTVQQKDSLLALIRVNAQPENLEYRYDYFRDNCSTRPRDLLDRARSAVSFARRPTVSPERRIGVRRCVSCRAASSSSSAVDIGLGEPSDEQLTTWTAMFLPRVLHDFVEAFRCATAPARCVRSSATSACCFNRRADRSTPRPRGSLRGCCSSGCSSPASSSGLRPAPAEAARPV
jgi:hypothetical protein